MHFFLLFSLILGGNAFYDLNVAKVCVEGYCFPKVVWEFWDEEAIPEDIEEIVNITRTTLKDFTLIFLTEANLSKFLDLNLFPSIYSNFDPRNKGDFVRVTLVTKYGGFWIDASTVVNDPAYLDNMISKAVKYKLEMVSYGHLNFFGSPENSVLMKNFKERFDELLNSKDPEQYTLEACEILRARRLEISCAKPAGKGDENFSFAVDYVLKKMVVLNPDFERKIKFFRHPVPPNGYLKKYGTFGEYLRCTSWGRTAPIVKIYHGDRNGKRLNLTGIPEVDCVKYNSGLQWSKVFFWSLLLIAVTFFLYGCYRKRNSLKTKTTKN